MQSRSHPRSSKSGGPRGLGRRVSFSKSLLRHKAKNFSGMETIVPPQTGVQAATEKAQASGVSWGAVIAGGVVASALTLMLLVFGVGMGFATVSPWSEGGISSTTRSIGAGVYLIVVAMLSSSIGGYLAGRLRTKW